MAITVKQYKKKVAKVTYDMTAQRAIDSAYTFDAADISDALDQITIVGHPYKTGDHVAAILTATTGVTATVPNATVAVNYWVIKVDANTISLATSLALAKAGTVTALTGVGAVDMFLQRDCFGTVGSGLVIPKDAIVTGAWVDVITACKSWDGAWGAGNEDDSSIAIGLLAADDVKATNVLDASTYWSATGIKGTLLGAYDTTGANDTQAAVAALFAAGMLKLTADAELAITITVDPCSAGKFDIYVEYYVA